MPSPPLDSTHGRMTSGVACHHHLWAAHMVELRRAWHAIIAFGKHKRSNNIGRVLPTSPLGSTHSRTTSGVACHNSPWTAHTVVNVGHGMASPPLDNTHGQKCQAWHDIAAFRQHTRSHDVGRGMPSSPFSSTHGRTTSRVACHHSTWMANTIE